MASKAKIDSGLLNPSTRKAQTGVRIRAALLVVAMVASAGLLYWQGQNIAVISAFVALVVSMTAIAYFLRPQAASADRDYAEPGDWAVTRKSVWQSPIGPAGWSAPTSFSPNGSMVRRFRPNCRCRLAVTNCSRPLAAPPGGMVAAMLKA